jgi:hypothetical protein
MPGERTRIRRVPGSSIDSAKRKRAAKRRQREDAFRRERDAAIANPGVARTPPAAVSVNEFRRATGASPATVARWVKKNVIKSVKVNRRRFIAFSEIARIRGEQA